MAATKKQQVIEVLKSVEDPELGMDIWTLGLVYEIKISSNNVSIRMTFTTPLCPYGPMLIELVEEALKTEIPGLKDVNIEVVFDPPWQPSEELRAMLGV